MKLELYTLQKNEKGEWGMWREYYKNGTACFWQVASEEQLHYLENINMTKRQLEKYIEQQKKIFERTAMEPIHFNICR
jgi:hypothetical protein